MNQGPVVHCSDLVSPWPAVCGRDLSGVSQRRVLAECQWSGVARPSEGAQASSDLDRLGVSGRPHCGTLSDSTGPMPLFLSDTVHLMTSIIPATQGHHAHLHERRPVELSQHIQPTPVVCLCCRPLCLMPMVTSALQGSAEGTAVGARKGQNACTQCDSPRHRCGQGRVRAPKLPTSHLCSPLLEMCHLLDSNLMDLSPQAPLPPSSPDVTCRSSKAQSFMATRGNRDQGVSSRDWRGDRVGTEARAPGLLSQACCSHPCSPTFSCLIRSGSQRLHSGF